MVQHDLQQIADRLGWQLKLIVPQTDEAPAEFFELVVRHRCFKLHEIEIGYVAMQVCEAADETDVWLSIPRWKSRRYAWPAAPRIAAHYGKTLFNPYVAIHQTQVDDYQLRQMVREAEAVKAK